MRNVLLTGGTGFIGRNIKPYLSKKCNLFTPNRFELNLYSEKDIRNYIMENKIDVVVHSANPNPAKNELDHQETMFEDSIRMFMNLYESRDCYEMMYTIGSGAEYDKSKDICSITEEDEFRSVPYDSYGLAKFTINQIVSRSDKLCNLRIFGCFGPTDHESKFITHAIRCCLRNEDITIRQNCYFDYMQVKDLGKVIEHFIYSKPNYTSYNVCTGVRKSLYQIAEEVIKQMGTNNKIVLLKDGLNKEYTASNMRLLQELGDYKFITIEEGITTQIKYEKENAR